MSLTSPRRIQLHLVPIPLGIQHVLKITSDTLPTLALLSFVVLQFVLNILRVIPAKYWQAWVDRTRIVLKSLLDPDFRHDRYQIELLRQRLANLDRQNGSLSQELELANESNRTLRERLITHTQGQDNDAIHANCQRDIQRLNRQLESQGKLLEETESLLETLRAGESARGSRLAADERKKFTDQIAQLKETLTTLTQERDAANLSLQSLQQAQQNMQEQSKKIFQTNSLLLQENESLKEQLSAADTREQNLTESERALRSKLELELQNANNFRKASEEQKAEMQREFEQATAEKEKLQQRLAQMQQDLATVEAHSGDFSSLQQQLQERLKALEARLEQSSKHEAQEKSDHDNAMKGFESKVAELEALLKEKNQITDELRKDVEHKSEEIARLNEALEHEGHHKLKKPRHDEQLTPPPTIGHRRSNSITSRLGFHRERSISGTHKTTSPSKVNGSPTASPAHRAQASLPSTVVSEPSNELATEPGSTTLADVSMSSTGSSTLAPPSSKHGRRKSIGSKQRLSSILGIHMGSPEK